MKKNDNGNNSNSGNKHSKRNSTNNRSISQHHALSTSCPDVYNIKKIDACESVVTTSEGNTSCAVNPGDQGRSAKLTGSGFVEPRCLTLEGISSWVNGEPIFCVSMRKLCLKRQHRNPSHPHSNHYQSGPILLTASNYWTDVSGMSRPGLGPQTRLWNTIEC